MLVLNQGKSQGYDHDIDDEWRDRKIHDQSGYIFHECKATTERLSSIEWADNLDPIHEWDNTLYWTAGEVAHTLDDLIHFRWHASPASPSLALRGKFEQLAQQWVSDTMFCSSSHDIVMHWAYQQVIGLGRKVVPLIYERMVVGDLHWTWALSAILGENPAANIYSPRAATDVWIAWIDDHNHQSQASGSQ